MAGFCDPGCNGVLTIGGISMNTPAWDVPVLTDLWVFTEQRGDSILIPHASGQRSTPRRLDEIEHDLEFHVTGEANQAGAPFANVWQGLQTNLAFLYTNVFQPVTTFPGTRAATLTMPTGSPRSAAVQAELLKDRDVVDARFAVFTLRLKIPAGMFV